MRRKIMEEIIVFGTGKYFAHKEGALRRRYRIAAFLDNMQEEGTQGAYRDTGIRMLNPKDAVCLGEKRIFLMSVHFIGMWKQLAALGVDPDRLAFPFFIEPYFENDDALCGCVEKIRFYGEYFECVCRGGNAERIADVQEWRAFLRKAYRRKYPLIGAVAGMIPEPVSRQFGTERGTPVDRHYIEKFLEAHKSLIKGDVLEIEDNAYSLKYGEGRLARSIVMDAGSSGNGIDFNANLESGEGIRDGIADCFILTQTLMYIYDLKSAARNIGRLLKKGGTALITCSGISQNSRRCMDDYGCFFNFNADALRKMFGREHGMEVIEAGSYGNAKTVIAHIGGLCSEDLEPEDFDANDRYYPLIVYAVVRKNG